MVGKWHLCPTVEMNLASTRRNWPTGRGFERWYGFLGAETSQWYPELTYDNHPVDQPRTPEEGYHFGEDITDKAIEFIMDAKAVAPEKPFFLYYAPGAAHAPHHAPKEWIEKYAGRFDEGYEAMRETTLARQIEMGIVPPNTELPPMNPLGTPETRTGPDGQPFPPVDITRPWDSLSDEEQRLFARMAEVYAGFLSHADAQIGRLLDYLEETGQRENTMVIVVSDNGASGEGGPDGSVNEMLFMNGIPDDIDRQPRDARRAGRAEDLQPLPQRVGDGLQHALQDVEALRVQRRHLRPVRDLVAGRHDRQGRDPRAVPPRDRPGAHRARRPGHRGARDDQGPHPEPLRRREHALQLRRPDRPGRAADAVLLDARVARHLARRLEGRHHAPDDQRLVALQRRRVGALPRRRRPLRAAQPRRRAPGQAPRDGQPLVRRGRRQRGLPARRPLGARRSSCRRARSCRRRATATSTSPTTPRCPRPRPWSCAAGRSSSARWSTSPQPGAQGVLFAQGSRFGGHSLYVKDNRLHYVNSFVGMFEQMVVATRGPARPATTSSCRRRSRRTAWTRRRVATGILSLYHGDTKVGEGRIKLQPGSYMIAGEGLAVGRDVGDPVTQDYPGERPYRFTGGTIKRVAVDVSGEPYIDLEREAQGMLMRE